MTQDADGDLFRRHLDLFRNGLHKHSGRAMRGQMTRFIAGRMLPEDMDAVADHLRSEGLIAIDLKMVRGKEARLYRWIADQDLTPAGRKPRDSRQVRPRTDAYMTLNKSIGQMTLELNNLRNEAALLGDKIGRIGEIAGQALANSERAERMADRLEQKGDDLIAALDRLINYTK